MKFIGFAAKTAFYLRKIQCSNLYWRIKYIHKCVSTEIELTNLLQGKEIKKDKPIVIISREQTAGFGQYKRHWDSPRGGIWLSAAYPIFSTEFSSQLFNLSVAINLCEMLTQEKIKVDLKWPNDIFFDSKKLIGFLPRVITRGKDIIYVRVGIGMNLLNKTPSGAISLAQILNTRNISEHYWTAKILNSFHDLINPNHGKEYIIKEANKFLSKSFLPKGYSSSQWKIKDIDCNGNLRVFNKTKMEIITRF